MSSCFTYQDSTGTARMQKDGRFVGFSEFPTVDLLTEAQRVYAATNVQTNVHMKRVDGAVPDPLPPPTRKRDVFKPGEFKEIDAHARQVTVTRMSTGTSRCHGLSLPVN